MTTQETQPAQAMVQRCASKPVAWRFAYCGCDQMVWLHEPPNDPVFRDVTPLYERPPTKTDGAAFETIGQIVEAYYTLNDEALPADVRMALANIALDYAALEQRLAESERLRVEGERRLQFMVSSECYAHRLSDTGKWMVLDAGAYPLNGEEHDTAYAAIDAALSAGGEVKP